MTNEQKEKIIELRKLGIGYRSIATAMDLSRDSVRNFCKSRGLDGFGQDYSKPKPEKVIREHCKNCGKRINQKKLKGRPKTYCSIECKREWEYKNPIIYQHACYYCGVEFENKSKSGNYCCRRCYIRDRFWRDEDIEMWSSILKREGHFKMYQYGLRTWWPVKKLKNQMKIRRNITNSAPTLSLSEVNLGG